MNGPTWKEMLAPVEPPVHSARGRLRDGLRGRLRWVMASLRGRQPPTITERLMASGVMTVGRRTYFAPDVIHHRGDAYQIRIGSFCSIAEGVTIMPGGNHRTDAPAMFPIRIKFDLPGAYEDGQPWTKGDVTIGNDVWIGRNTNIMGGVTIGDGAVVGAYSLVNHDVAPFEVVAGAPARHIRHRFDADTIAALIEIAWWEWDDDQIIARVGDLTCSDVPSFIARYRNGS